ncbi:MAG: NifB/NifX family molybdenum-iron cluster-binding protein [Bacillota bacterium]
MALRIACATDDGEKFVNRHFGDADYYYIYELDEKKAEFITKIDNNSVEEEKHADPKKAKSVVQILKEEDVQCGVSCAFGPNIKRVKKHIVPIIMENNNLEEGLKNLVSKFSDIEKSWKKGKNREHIKIN